MTVGTSHQDLIMATCESQRCQQQQGEFITAVAATVLSYRKVQQI